MAPFMIRNSPIYPHHTSIGYTSKEEYWSDASSKNYIAKVSIPLLVCYANDDDILSQSNCFASVMKAYMSNPNIIVVSTPCGGHIGWHCSRHPLNPFGSFNFMSTEEIDKSWADRVAIKFISALMMIRASQEYERRIDELHSLSFMDDLEGTPEIRKDVARLARKVTQSSSASKEGMTLSKL
jgi:hypothetical protein